MSLWHFQRLRSYLRVIFLLFIILYHVIKRISCAELDWCWKWAALWTDFLPFSSHLVLISSLCETSVVLKALSLSFSLSFRSASFCPCVIYQPRSGPQSLRFVLNPSPSSLCLLRSVRTLPRMHLTKAGLPQFSWFPADRSWERLLGNGAVLVCMEFVHVSSPPGDFKAVES